MIITIDGPTASGKSTIARALAQQLGYYYIYSGLLFRGLAYLLIKEKNYNSTTIDNPDQCDIDILLDRSTFQYHYENGIESLFFNGNNISSFLKTSIIDQCASIVSTNIYVRRKMITYQHYLASHHNIVTDGRDSGSVVYPNADYKLYITATIAERARRWRYDQQKNSAPWTQHEAEVFITERDHRDSSRKEAPLVIPHNAHIIDTTGKNPENIIKHIIALIEK